MIDTMHSMAPAAPSMCPVHDLVELTLRSAACEPKTALIALVSFRSLAGVEVPCALMYWTSARPRPASSIARRMARCARSEEHTSELQSRQYLVCRLLLEKKKIK